MIKSQRFKPVYIQKVRSPEEHFLIAQSTERSTEIVSWKRDKSSAVKIGSVSDSGSMFSVCFFVGLFFIFVYGNNNFPKCPADHLVQTAGWLLLHMQ